MIDMDWPLALPAPALPGPGTASCWRILVGDIDRRLQDRLAGLLAADEHERADRFRRPDDRRSYTAAHAGLRLLLASALGCGPGELRFVRGPTGKPSLANCGVEFNLSHSGGIVLIALARQVPVGADVERLREVPGRDQIVRRYLHPGEQTDLAALPPAAAEAAFFHCWTRKEAVAKALGLGLQLPLGGYRVSCRPGVPAALLAIGRDGPPPGQWSLHDLTPGPGHVGALAVPAPSIRLDRHTLAWPR